MSMGKRLAKRSIVGSKVVVLHDDGFYYPATIQAVKTAEMDGINGGHQITKYAVRSEATRQLREYSEVDLIGPGFQSTAGITLNPGQRIFVTYGGREVTGNVTKHRPDVDEVHIVLQGSNLVRKASATGVSWYPSNPVTKVPFVGDNKKDVRLNCKPFYVSMTQMQKETTQAHALIITAIIDTPKLIN